MKSRKNSIGQCASKPMEAVIDSFVDDEREKAWMIVLS